jgi:hypothetical protein
MTGHHLGNSGTHQLSTHHHHVVVVVIRAFYDEEVSDSYYAAYELTDS